MLTLKSQIQSNDRIPLLPFYFIIQHSTKLMSKIHKKQKTPLKFDTSSANIGCFIRGKSKQKICEHDRYSTAYKSKRRSRHDRQKMIEFQDKAFLQSVVCKILNDADCQGITELIDEMVFPGSSTSEIENTKDSNCEYTQQQQISQIFSNFTPNSQKNHNNNITIYPQTQEIYRVIPPIQYAEKTHRWNNRQEKQECRSTIQSSMIDSMTQSPRSVEQTNPELISTVNPVLPIAYGYNYYPQGNYLYQRQLSQRKKRNVTGEQVNQYKIIPQKIQLDGRTTLMIRHIPNKYSQEMLYEQLGRNHKMKINFLYLPIDHFNSCNVGYAFVNFIHSKFIIEFYKQFNGRRWDRFNSEKICELAYARIQGTTNLMDHFQNSAGNQLRGRTQSKVEERKSKSSLEDETSFKNITKNLDFQKVEDS